MPKITWNDENTAKLQSLYNGNNDELGAIAKEMQTTVASVRCKLVNMGTYKAPEKAVTTKASKASKADLVSAAETLLGVKKGSLASLERGTMQELTTLTESLKSLSANFNAEKGVKE